MLPAEHMPSTKRIWYKVKWVKNPPGMKVEGKFDLIMDEDLQKYRDFVGIVEEISAKTCATIPVLGFGKLTEEKIDSWIKENR